MGESNFDIVNAQLVMGVVPFAISPFGKFWFVNPAIGDDDGEGTLPNKALATINGAIARAASGDSIYVAPGTYEENVVVDKDYITLIGGYGAGYARPDIAPAAGRGLYVEASQGFIGHHLRFVSADDDAALNEGNGFKFSDCVFDGDGNGVADCGLRLKGNADDDSYTASEGEILNCLFRGSGGFGLGFDTAEPTVAVGSTHNVIRGCRFMENTGPDISSLDTGPGTYCVKDALIEQCYFMTKNKATHIDFQTFVGSVGAAENNGLILNCYFADDALDTTAIKMVGTGFALVGCWDSVGPQDGSAFD